MPPDYDGLSAEIIRLRNWRHDVAAPTLLALRERATVTEDLLARTAEIVERLERKDVIETAVSKRLHRQRGLFFSRGEKALLTLLAAPAAINLVLRLAGVG